MEGLEAWEELHFQQRGQQVTESITIKDILQGDVREVYGTVKGSGPSRGSPMKAHVEVVFLGLGDLDPKDIWPSLETFSLFCY